MKYASTRGAAPLVSIGPALAAGLAPDGGLYVPQTLPHLELSRFDGAHTLAEIGPPLLAPFFDGDDLLRELPAICAQAFDFETPLVPIDGDKLFQLELFHGPTAAFKDIGARFLAACLQRLPRSDTRPLTIVVATSGDTGAAVAAAFHQRPGMRVVILYPDGRVSPRQAHQLGCFGDNVFAFAVKGNFDDCQAMAKQALADTDLQSQAPLSSANSISLGRWLPQMVYYAQASLAHHRRTGQLLNLIIPTGNLGNAAAAALARRIGLPIGRIVLSTNANNVLPEFFDGADYAPQPSRQTLANAMDVGAPSNFERLRWMYPDAAALRAAFTAVAASDDQIRDAIVTLHKRTGQVVCPHTATALHALDVMDRDPSQAWAIVATAHAAKFETVVEPLVRQAVAVPPALADLLARPSHAEALRPDYGDLRDRILSLDR
ncbi:MAG: threonine synthase [Gammaproteobacteria bacterium]|nr:threonine synthase [Gammaproteobacteria bacterium]